MTRLSAFTCFALVLLLAGSLRAAELDESCRDALARQCPALKRDVSLEDLLTNECFLENLESLQKSCGDQLLAYLTTLAEQQMRELFMPAVTDAGHASSADPFSLPLLHSVRSFFSALPLPDAFRFGPLGDDMNVTTNSTVTLEQPQGGTTPKVTVHYRVIRLEKTPHRHHGRSHRHPHPTHAVPEVIKAQYKSSGEHGERVSGHTIYAACHGDRLRFCPTVPPPYTASSLFEGACMLRHYHELSDSCRSLMHWYHRTQTHKVVGRPAHYQQAPALSRPAPSQLPRLSLPALNEQSQEPLKERLSRYWNVRMNHASYGLITAAHERHGLRVAAYLYASAHVQRSSDWTCGHARDHC